MSFGKDKNSLYGQGRKLSPDDMSGGIFKIKEEGSKRLLTLDKKKNYEGIQS